MGVVENGRRVRADSERIGRDVTVTRLRVLTGRRLALDMTTAAVDRKGAPHPLMTARLERLSVWMGRSPLIEQAKAVLAQQYGISRGEAFKLMTVISSNSNRKLRAVAEQLLEDQRVPPKAASSPR
jgi:hypothetical protein